MTGTVKDVNGILWAGGTISATLVVPGGTSPTLNGVGFTGSMSPIGLDSTGSFTARLADNNVVLPSGTQWKFLVNHSGAPPPLGTGPQTCTATLTITGASQSISNSFNQPGGNFAGICPSLGNILVPAGDQDTKIVLQNTDFEFSSTIPPPGWLFYATVSYETVSPFPGKNQSIKIVNNQLSTGLASLQKFSARPGDTYYIQAALKSDGTVLAQPYIGCYDKTNTFISGAGQPSTGTTSTSWVTQNNTGTIPANAVYCFVFLQNNNALGTAWYDQIVVRNVTPTTTTFANLGAVLSAGNSKYCTDCTTAATCASGGTGHMAVSNGTNWTCQ